MSNQYEKKRYNRQKELNSRRGLHQCDDVRRRRSRYTKRTRLCTDNDSDFSLVNPPYSLMGTQRSLSNDDETMDVINSANIPDNNSCETKIPFSSALQREESTNQMLNLSKWIRIDEEFTVTSFGQFDNNLNEMKNRCRQAIPHVDHTILNDLNGAFHHPPTHILCEIIHICQFLPYRIQENNGSLREQARYFMSRNQVTEDQVRHICRINQQITFRSSYGVLFLQDDKFFAKSAPNRGNRHSAIKGFPRLKLDGQLEHPWETAVRMTKQEVQYWNDELKSWEPFDLNEHVQSREQENYLECLMTSVPNTQYFRYIGLFIIHLKPSIRIGLFGSNQTEDRNWYSIAQNINNNAFYTILPFLKYIHEQSDNH